MKCDNCGKNFHYCSSCDRISEAELGFCSETCLLNYLRNESNEESKRIEILVDYLKYEYYFPKDTNDELVKEVQKIKGKVADRLVDRILEDW